MSATKAICPACQSNNTIAHYEHRPCPSAPTGITTWEAEAFVGPDNKPINRPCPGCNDGVPRPPAYLYCKNCGHRWTV